MKRVLFILIILLICSKQDFFAQDIPATNKKSLSHLSIGIGVSSKGLVAGLAAGFITSSNGLGAEIEYKIIPYVAEKLPEDFADENVNLVLPRDLLNSFSFKIQKDFRTASPKFKIGVDFGPDIIVYNFVDFTINPNYPGLPFDYEKKYFRHRHSELTAGFSTSAKLKYNLKFMALQSALFANINKIKSVFGLEFYIGFPLD
jgi:hypothetical protein